MTIRALVSRGLACLLFIAGVLTADDSGIPTARERARIAIAMHMTPAGLASQTVLSMGPLDLAAGEVLQEASFAAPASGPTCSMEINIGGPQGLVEEHPLVWTASAEVLSVSTDQIVLNARWARFTLGPDGQPLKVHEEPGTRLTLREGDRVLLDYADRTPSGEPLCMRNFSLELSAALAEDPGLARRQIAYDLWLVHESPEGGKSSRHFGQIGTQGQQLSFGFEDEKVLPRGDAPGKWLSVSVRGTIRGRVRRDGSMSLSIDALRGLGYKSSDDETGGTRGWTTSAILDAQPGEALRIELPWAQEATATDPYARDLAGHSFGLIVTSKPLR